MEIKEKDLLTSFEDFENKNNIKEERNDVPKRFLGFCPSRYYKVVDMDVEKLRNKVSILLNRFLATYPR